MGEAVLQESRGSTLGFSVFLQRKQRAQVTLCVCVCVCAHVHLRYLDEWRKGQRHWNMAVGCRPFLLSLQL